MNQNVLVEVIKEYFAFEISARTAQFHVTRQYRKLMEKRFEAESKIQMWKVMLVHLQQNLETVVNDETQLDRANCYECSFRLSLDVNDNLCRKYVRLFCSILVPVAYLAIEEESEDSSGSLIYPLPCQIEEEECLILKNTVFWLQSEGYTLLTDSAHSELDGLALEYTNDGEVTIFDCLFSEFADNQSYAVTLTLLEACL